MTNSSHSSPFMPGFVDLVNCLLESSHRLCDQDFYNWPLGSSLKTTNWPLNSPTVCPIFHLFFLSNICWILLSVWNHNGSSRHQTSVISSNLFYSQLMHCLPHLSVHHFLRDWPLSQHLSSPLQACACFPTLYTLLPSPSFQIFLFPILSHPQFPCHMLPYHPQSSQNRCESLSDHPFPFPIGSIFYFYKNRI